MDKAHFIVAQKAIIKNGEKYLILKRRPTASTYPNHWDFPGGKLEIGERPSEGLEREVNEETGLAIVVKHPVLVFSEDLNGHETVFIVYEAEASSKQVTLSHEHTEFKWASRDEILALPIENYLKELFR